MAPPALRPLATALAVASLGVGIAIAKAQRERRSERSPRGPHDHRRPHRDRRPSLRADEPLAAGLQRVILGQLDLAIELLERYPAQTDPAARDPRTVHEVRKALKRVRALLRLLRRELGAKRYARENAALRDCARRLAGARDAEVMVGTLDSLLARHPQRLAHSAAVRALRAQLLAERDAATASGIGDPRVRAAVAGELRAVRRRIERRELHERGFKLLAPGLERLYRKGRRGLRVARRRGDVESMHAWRKRVKDLRYAAETLDRAKGAKRAHTDTRRSVTASPAATTQRKPAAKRARRIARRADRVGEMLGEEHDLALLARGVRERSAHFARERRTRKRLLKLIARRRKALRRKALREGERLYRRSPRRFVRRLRRRA